MDQLESIVVRADDRRMYEITQGWIHIRSDEVEQILEWRLS